MSTALSPAASSPAPSRALHVTLWVVQVLLGGAFFMAGLMKATAPMDQLALNMPWTVPAGVVLTRFVGISELAGGLGLILPGLLRIRPGLISLAALGLAVVMVLAFGLHVIQAEYAALPINVVLGGLSVFVAWGRYSKAPISPRGR